ncbi:MULTISPECIES: helix-turn-helix domain-containing protein [unclassified Maridesulfovibrio]|uniref:helix-turn-helix domain-containing protein n=1 Tax=unclassified Maridesulfovibrio TaxID=2794999 RepID=UPI003B41C4BA
MGKNKKDWARLWKPVKESRVSLYKAEIQTFSFKKHSHESYALGVIEDGVQQFRLGGAKRVAPASAMIAINPGEVHDGESAVPDGCRYRVAYFNDELLSDIFFGLYGDRRSVSYFKSPVLFDRDVSAALLHAHQFMEGVQNNMLAAESLMMQVVAEVFLRHGDESRSPCPVIRNTEAVKKAINYIRKNAAENISVNDIAAVAGLSPYYFLRQFKAITGLPPHAYLMQCRVYLARRAVDQGVPLVDAALQAGFADQAHFSRSFKAIHGFPPSQYQKDLHI